MGEFTDTESGGRAAGAVGALSTAPRISVVRMGNTLNISGAPGAGGDVFGHNFLQGQEFDSLLMPVAFGQPGVGLTVKANRPGAGSNVTVSYQPGEWNELNISTVGDVMNITITYNAPLTLADVLTLFNNMSDWIGHRVSASISAGDDASFMAGPIDETPLAGGTGSGLVVAIEGGNGAEPMGWIPQKVMAAVTDNQILMGLTGLAGNLMNGDSTTMKVVSNGVESPLHHVAAALF